jgi:hypothetical protein
MCLLQHSPTDAEDQRPVTAHEHLDSGLVAVGQELLQELPVARRRPRDAPDQVADVLEDGIALGHARGLRIDVHLSITHAVGHEQIAFFSIVVVCWGEEGRAAGLS